MTVIEDFEGEFRKFTGAKYAVAVSNGTTALHVALLAVGVKRGDYVITTPFTHISTVNSILYCGAIPIFADINPKTYCVDELEVEKQFKKHPNVKAVLCVHLFGNTCNTVAIKRLCDKYKAKLIEDCAQAFGANIKRTNTSVTAYGNSARMTDITQKWEHVGNVGDFGTFSFYASKNLWTFEGGMLITNNLKLARLARLIRSHGQSSKYCSTVLGYNYRMPQICALVGLTAIKLHLKGIISELGMYGPQHGHYPCVVYDQPIYKKLGITGNCPKAEEVARIARRNFEAKHGKWGEGKEKW